MIKIAEFHALFVKNLIFSKGGTCSAILAEKAKVELIPPFLLEATVELVPPTLKDVYLLPGTCIFDAKIAKWQNFD